MENKIYKPLIGRMFWIIWVPTVILLIVATVISTVSVVALIILLATDVFTFYFLLTSLVGYVELRENEVFIKFGFILKTEIPYKTIRGITKERKMYADSLKSIKNSMEHVNIKYNRFDLVSVSVRNNEEFIKELKTRVYDN